MEMTTDYTCVLRNHWVRCQSERLFSYLPITELRPQRLPHLNVSYIILLALYCREETVRFCLSTSLCTLFLINGLNINKKTRLTTYRAAVKVIGDMPSAIDLRWATKHTPNNTEERINCKRATWCRYELSSCCSIGAGARKNTQLVVVMVVVGRKFGELGGS